MVSCKDCFSLVKNIPINNIIGHYLNLERCDWSNGVVRILLFIGQKYTYKEYNWSIFEFRAVWLVTQGHQSGYFGYFIGQCPKMDLSILIGAKIGGIWLGFWKYLGRFQSGPRAESKYGGRVRSWKLGGCKIYLCNFFYKRCVPRPFALTHWYTGGCRQNPCVSRTNAKPLATKRGQKPAQKIPSLTGNKQENCSVCFCW